MSKVVIGTLPARRQLRRQSIWQSAAPDFESAIMLSVSSLDLGGHRAHADRPTEVRQMLKDQTRVRETAEEIQASIEDGYRNNLY